MLHTSGDMDIFLSLPRSPPTLVTQGLGSDPSACTRLWPSDGEGRGGLTGGMEPLKVQGTNRLKRILWHQAVSPGVSGSDLSKSRSEGGVGASWKEGRRWSHPAPRSVSSGKFLLTHLTQHLHKQLGPQALSEHCREMSP